MSTDSVVEKPIFIILAIILIIVLMVFFLLDTPEEKRIKKFCEEAAEEITGSNPILGDQRSEDLYERCLCQYLSTNYCFDT